MQIAKSRDNNTLTKIDNLFFTILCRQFFKYILDNTVINNDITRVTATKGGTATHNYGTAVTYYLYEGSTKIGTFSGNTLSFTPSVGAHTYKTVASGGGISKDGASASITVVSPHKTLKIYSSSGWVECIIYRYNGSSFIEVEPYYYDGTNWSECSHT